ncbi:glutamate-rich protein 3 isoform X2 [Eublepharis macularius]|uniref:Glutamate-rich protein 3 isoform X2 n=1 Tax=Eublepharis macularius TaxID=481883 RepID=A0AA97KZZ3_EUBMA|nr:glutamate-rich protein 3 isoform X2 [Eublepharis macularius]
MNHPHPGFLANYNSLTDKYLAGYFSNTRIRRHLQRSGLVSRSGRIISEKEYRLNTMKKDHQKYIRECLAQAIFHKVLDMERHHQVETKRKLENSVRKERIQRIKVERSKRSAEDKHFLLSPHPPTAPKNHFGRHRLGDRGQLGHSTTYPRPSTAPGNIQHPVRLQPLYSNAMTEPTLKTASSSRPKFSTFEKAQGEKSLRPMYSMDFSSGISPYQLPIINNYVMPIPPLPPKNEKNVTKHGTSRRRRYRPTTAPNSLEQSLMKDAGKFYKSQVHTNAYVTMIYLGKTVHLCHDLFDCRDEIKIYQQHCGGENVCVYRGKVLEGDTFHFISKRHHGFPFSLTFYLNGMQVDRLSSCCEYKHRKGSRLGGKHGHFGFVNVERSSPCYKCIIAMGLDEKPFPPKKKMTEKDKEKRDFKGKRLSYKLTKNSISAEENKDTVSMASSPPEDEFTGGFTEMEMEARRIKGNRIKWERNLRRVPDYAYDEDFEADEEKSDEKVNEEGRVDDQMNGMSKSPSDDEKDNLDHEKESKNSSQKALQASDSERDESDGSLESDLEEDKQGKAADLEMVAAARKIQSFYRKHKGLQQTQKVQPDRKCVPSLSSSSIVYSSENDSDRETRGQDEDKENSDIHSEYENENERKEDQETSLEEEEDISEAENTTDKNVSSISHENMIETNLQDITLVTETAKHIWSVDLNVRENREEDVLVHLEGNIPEAEYRSKELSDTEDRGEYKLVKEKIAEAIEKDHLLSSEPEDSDSSAEEEEENIISAQDKNEVPDGDSLAEELKMLGSQAATLQVEKDKQMVSNERTLEEEERLAEEGCKETALEEKSSAKNIAALTLKQAVKNEPQGEERELEKAALVEFSLEMDSVEKDMIYEEGKSYEGNAQEDQEVEKLKETVLGDGSCKREDILEGYHKLERKDVEDQMFIGGLMANKEASNEVAEETGETAAVLEAIKLEGRKATMEEEEHGVNEVIEAETEADVVMGTVFMEKDTVGMPRKTMEEAEAGGSETLQKTEHEEESGGKPNVIKNEITEGISLNGDEYVNVELKSDPIMETQLVTPASKEVEFITIYKNVDVPEESVPGSNGLVGEVSSDQEESCLMEEKLETTSRVSKMKILSNNEDVAREKLATWMDEPLLDWEAERGMLLREEENKNSYGAIVTTEREEKADKQNAEGNSEKEATVKDRLLVEDPTQEEESPMEAVEVGVEEELIEQVSKSKVTGPERKLITKKDKCFTEDAIAPEAMVMLAEETIMMSKPEEVEAEEAEEESKALVKGKVEAEEVGGKVVLKGKEEVEEYEAEREVEIKGKVEDEEAVAERKVLVKGKVESEEAELGRKTVLKGKVEAEEAEVEREVVVKEKVEAEATEVEREVVVKGKVEAEEAEVGRKMVLKGKVEAEATEVEREVVVKGKVEAEEAEVEREVVVKEKVEAEATEVEREVVVKGKVEAEEAEVGRKMVLKGMVEAEATEVERDVVVKGKVEAEEAEVGRKMVLKEKVEAEATEVEREVVVKGKVEAEEAEVGRKMVLKGKVEAEEAEVEIEVVVKGKVDAEEAEAGKKVVMKRTVEAEHLETKGEVVSVDSRPKGEIVSEVSIVGGHSIEDVTAAKAAETQQVSESSIQKEERRKENDARLQEEVKTASEETLRAEESIDTLLLKEVVTVEDEKAGIEEKEEGMGGEIVPIKYVEEAILFGIQKLISEVSQISVEAMKDGLEDLIEEMSPHEDATREDIFVAVGEERQISQSDSSEERETKELVEVIHLEEKRRSGSSQISHEESHIENLPVTESIHVITQHSESEQQQDFTAQMIYLEAHTSSDLEDRN